MALQQSIAKYERITHETFQQSPDLALKVIGDNFMLWKLAIRDGVPFFWIDQTYAKSFSVFVPFIREVCAAADVETIVTATTRNGRAHIKKWGMVRLPEFDYQYENRHYHVLKGHLSKLK